MEKNQPGALVKLLSQTYRHVSPEFWGKQKNPYNLSLWQWNFLQPKTPYMK